MTNGDLRSLEELKALSESAVTSEDCDAVERHLRAYELADTETTRQKATLERLTQQAAAWLISVSTKHLRDQGAARNQDLTYHGPDLVQWIITRQVDAARRDWERASDVEKTAKERQAEARATKLEEQAKALQDRYIERDEVRRDFSLLFGRLQARLMSLGAECAAIAPGELKATIKQIVEERVRIALKELTDGNTV